MIVTPFNGGMAIVLSFCSSTALFVISSQFQVLVSIFHSLFFIKLIYCLSLGSAVAIEWIFSGGRDTISLRRAGLKPETIRVLMLVKRKLIIAKLCH